MNLRANCITLAMILASPCAIAGQGQPPETTNPPDTSQSTGPISNGWDTPPKLIQGKGPVYPVSLVMSGGTCESVIVFTVGADGKAKDFEVESSTDERCSNHAIIAMKKWVFEPATKNGTRIDSRGRQKFFYGPK